MKILYKGFVYESVYQTDMFLNDEDAKKKYAEHLEDQEIAGIADNQHVNDMENRGTIKGRELYKLMYTHTEGYYDFSRERQLIGGDASEFEFKTEANSILKANGFDGITHLDKYNPGDKKTAHIVFIAFDPNQVKSAISNSGAYGDTNSIVKE